MTHGSTFWQAVAHNLRCFKLSIYLADICSTWHICDKKGAFDFVCFTSNVGPWWCWCCRPAVLWWITGEMRRSEAREKLKFTMPELQQAAGAGWKLLLHRMGKLVAGFLMSVSQKRLRFVVSLSLLCWWCLNNAFSKFSTYWENRELLAEVSICAEQQTGQSTKADGVRALERLRLTQRYQYKI